MDTYSKELRRIICSGLGQSEEKQPLSGYKIVVDAGNGVGGFFVDKVLKPLGADTNGSVLLNPDGMFPTHIPNPENKAAMDSISKAVTDSGADLGLIFDTDVDRAACVDKSGAEINRNRLIALASAIALQNEDGGTVVTDSVTSDGLHDFIENTLKGTHYRYRRGYNNVISKARELNDQGINCPLAIETSGHAALRENYFLDDGAYLMTKVIIEFAKQKQKGKDIDNLISSLKVPSDEAELRFTIVENDYKAAGERVIKRLYEFAKAENGMEIAPDNAEGIRVSLKNGWFMLRLSVHDPVMPFNAESDIPFGTKDILERLLPFFEGCAELDISPVRNALKL